MSVVRTAIPFTCCGGVSCGGCGGACGSTLRLVLLRRYDYWSTTRMPCSYCTTAAPLHCHDATATIIVLHHYYDAPLLLRTTTNTYHYYCVPLLLRTTTTTHHYYCVPLLLHTTTTTYHYYHYIFTLRTPKIFSPGSLVSWTCGRGRVVVVVVVSCVSFVSWCW